MKVLFTYDYGAAAFQRVEALGYEVFYCPEKLVHDFEALDQMEILVCYNPFERLELHRLKALKYIFLSSAGVDQVPKEEALSRGIRVTNNRGGYSVPIGEWVVWTILSIYKNAKYFYGNQLKHKWALSTEVFELSDKKVGIIGTGSIGQACAQRLSGFGVECIGFNTSGRPAPNFDTTYAIEQLAQIVAACDILLVTVPYTEKTHGLIGEGILEAMRDQSVLINVSRGPIVVEAALLKALEAGKFLGVGLDVFDQEPLPEDHGLWQFERVYLTPHNSWVSERRNERRFETLMTNFKRLSEGASLVNEVDLKRGY